MIILCDGCGKKFYGSIVCPYCGEMEVERPIGDRRTVRGQTKECMVMDDMSFENNMFEDADILLDEDFH
jgi:hypothetical protein